MLTKQVFLLVLVTSWSQVLSWPSQLELGALFWSRGTSSTAFFLAIDWVNKQPDLLPGVTLFGYENVTGPSKGLAVSSTIHQVTERGVIGMVGLSSSSLAMIGNVVSGTVFKKPQISNSATSPLLSNKADYNYFLRTIPADDLQGAAMAAICHAHGWEEVVTLFSNDVYGETGIAEFTRAATDLNIEVIASSSHDPEADNVGMFKSQLSKFRQAGGRIFILFTNSNPGQAVVQAATELGMWDVGFAFVGSETLMSVDAERPITGMVGLMPVTGLGDRFEQFLQEWQGAGEVDDPSFYTTAAYDAVLAYAHALTKMQTLDEDPFNGDILLDRLTEVRFVGVTGEVMFDDQRDRIAPLESGNHQLVDDEFCGLRCKPVIVPTGIVTLGEDGGLTSYADVTIRWPGDTTKLPKDNKFRPWLASVDYVNNMTVLLMASCVCVGGVLSVVAFGLSFVWADTPVFKSGSLFFFRMIIVATLIGLVGCVLLVVDVDRVPFAKVEQYCWLAPFLLGVYSTTTCSALLAKSYRIHRIFNNRRLQKHPIPLSTLIRVVALHVIVEIVLFVVWVGVDRPRLRQLVTDDRTLEYECYSDHQNRWGLLILGYHGYLLVLNLYFAMKNRAVDSMFSESETIAVIVYNFTVTGVVVVSTVFFLDLSLNTRVAITSIGCLFVILVTLTSLLVPKIMNRQASFKSSSLTTRTFSVSSNKGSIYHNRELFTREGEFNPTFLKTLVTTLKLAVKDSQSSNDKALGKRLGTVVTQCLPLSKDLQNTIEKLANEVVLARRQRRVQGGFRQSLIRTPSDYPKTSSNRSSLVETVSRKTSVTLVETTELKTAFKKLQDELKDAHQQINNAQAEVMRAKNEADRVRFLLTLVSTRPDGELVDEDDARVLLHVALDDRL